MAPGHCYKLPLLTAAHLSSEMIRANGFTQCERFVTETELGQIDGITPQAALLGGCKSHRCSAIKNVSPWIKDTLAMNFLFFSLLKLRKYDIYIWREQKPWSESGDRLCNVSGHTIPPLLYARG